MTSSSLPIRIDPTIETLFEIHDAKEKAKLRERRYLDAHWTQDHLMTDDVALDLLRDILALRQLVLNSSTSQYDRASAATEALVRTQALIEGVSGSAYNSLSPITPQYDYADEILYETLEWQRSQVLYALETSPSLIPPVLIEKMVDAFRQLDGGVVRDLVAPSEKDGRGADPNTARLAEERMLFWTEFQAGFGVSKDSAIRQVADAVARSSKAIEAWKATYLKREGERYAKAALRSFFRAGQALAAGKPDPTGWAKKFIDDFPLEGLAKEWKRAKRRP